MCGIAGILGRITPANRMALDRMNAAMSHRGPDGSGSFETTADAEGRGAMLAHRRLSILDLSPAAAQPMVDPITGNVLTFNGELYNYVALRRELADDGEPFASTGDTEVMLRALSARGRQAVSAFRGMFAFAFWDADRQELVMARDPLGIKPLYLARNPDPAGDWSLLFASELRAILASGLLGTPRLDPRAVASVVWNGFVVGPHTAVTGVESVWPGQLRVFAVDGTERVAEDHWSAAARSAATGMDEERLADVLRECVQLHLASDVPLGVFLSGGVDSSAVANLAQQTSPGGIHTFTLAFEEEAFDEGPFARQIAAAIGTQHQEVVLTEQQFVGQLEQALYSLDQPTFDGLNSYYMSRAVCDAGFKVALVGTGGDELFGGYTSFRDLPALLRGAQSGRWIPPRLRLAAARLASLALQPSGGAIAPQTRWAKLVEMVRRGEDIIGLYQVAYALFLPDLQRELLDAACDGGLIDGLPPSMHARLLEEVRDRSPLSAISVLEERLFLGERLLRDTDAASMAPSIELRLPLVDRVLFEAVDRLPDEVRYLPARRKAILRRIGLRGLDPALFARPKSGFVLPFDRWIRRSLGPVMDRTLRDPVAVAAVGLNPDAVSRVWRAFLDGAPGLYWSRVWALYVLVHWCQQHGIRC